MMNVRTSGIYGRVVSNWDVRCVKKESRSSGSVIIIDHHGNPIRDVMHTLKEPLATVYPPHGQLKNIRAVTVRVKIRCGTSVYTCSLVNMHELERM